MKVRIKEDINLKDLAENDWNGCQSWTMDFLKKFYGKNQIFEVEITHDGDYRIYNTMDKDDDYIIVNHKCFEKVQENNDEWKDIEEINNDYYDEVNNYISKGGKEISNGELVDKINQLIKNQKYLKEKLEKK